MAPIFASLTLLGVAILAMFPDPRTPLLSEKAALFFLFGAFLLALWPPLQRRLFANRDAATFALLCAFFVLFHLADRAGPREGWALHFSFLPDDQFVLSYALRLAVVGALISLPAWRRSGSDGSASNSASSSKGGGAQRFVFAALLLVGIFGLGITWFLAKFYPLGATQTLDPTPLPTLLTQILGFGAIATLCRVATASPVTLRLWLRGLPLILLLVGAKLNFFPLPLPAEEAE